MTRIADAAGYVGTIAEQAGIISRISGEQKELNQLPLSWYCVRLQSNTRRVQSGRPIKEAKFL